MFRTEAIRTVARVTWPALLVMLAMLMCGIASIVALSATRAYLAHYAAWVAAERDIAAYMSSYVNSPSPGRHQAIEGALRVWAADHAALLGLAARPTDYAAVRRQLEAGGTAASDVGGMIWLIRGARLTGRLSGPLELCAQLDRLFSSYDALWREVAGGWAQGPPPRAERLKWYQAIHRIHHRVIPLEKRLALSINAEAQALARWLLAILVLSSAAMILACYWATYRIVAATGAMASALRAEQERAALLLGSISDAVVSTDERGVVQYLNSAAERLSGWTQAEAQGRPLGQILRLETTDGERLDLNGALVRVLSDGEPTPVTNKREQLVLPDGRVTPVGERVTPIRGPNGAAVGAVVVMRDVTPERRLSEQLRYQTLHDSLTGLGNRTKFEQVLAAGLREAQHADRAYAAMFVDLDQFKIVNDTCGHHAGDELICLAGAAVRQAVDEDELVARLGGDEFGVVLHDRGLEDTMRVAEAIRRGVEELHFVQQGRTFRVAASVGVVHDDPSLRTVTEVLRAADRACYAAKEAGRNQVRLYKATDQTIGSRNGDLQWVARLNLALEEERLELHSQEIRPLHAAAGSDACELLLRLRDESGGLILPGSFIPAAERFGLMTRVDRWVIAQACAEQGRRLRAGMPAQLCMVNLSRTSVDNADIAAFIAARLREHALPPGCIGFELTETAAIANLKVALEVMQQLRQLGCPLALDDFGSGMSSYRYLSDLPVDIVKIDGSFVRKANSDPVARAMIDAIHNVARAAGLRTVAEGVEDQATLDTLSRLNIDFVQGYAVGREQLWLAGRGLAEASAESA